MAQMNPSSQNQGQMRGQSMGGGQGQSDTGLSDLAYDVVTLLSECGQAAEAMNDYIDDAREANDQQVAQLFEQIRQDYIRHAEMLRQAVNQLVKQGKF
jgi:rubrerythrin